METYSEEPTHAHPLPHPYLQQPLLYASNLPPYVADDQIAQSLAGCGAFRPIIHRDENGATINGAGTIQFKTTESAEKALATAQSRLIPGLQIQSALVLSPFPPTFPPTSMGPPQAIPRLVKHLPPAITDAELYDWFRPFGALASAKAQTHFGPDTGMVEYWSEEDARVAEEAMHCTEIQGQNIAVQAYQPRRTSGSISEFSPNAPVFIPSGAVPYQPYASPPRASYPMRSPVHTPPAAFQHGPGQRVQVAPLSGPGSTSHSGLIDPCNLFCKNLDPEIDSNGLFAHFKEFGQIVSARVMRNETGESRGFGFVSYHTPDQATAAMHAMNGRQLGSKQVVVRLHEPKQLRQEKLAQRFAGQHNGHPRSSSGATSPTLSEGGESYAGWGSPRHHSTGLGSPVAAHYDRPDRGRRSSGSYYNAALAGNLQVGMHYEDLVALSPVVRRELLAGEYSRRLKLLGSVPANDVDAVIEFLVGMSLSEVVDGIEHPGKLAEQIQHAQNSLRPPPPPAQLSSEKSPSRSVSQDSRLLDPELLNTTASAPEHPSTPISIAASLSTPPRTSSPSGSVAPTSERDRMGAAIAKLETSRQQELTDLLMSLPKRDRAMCLFNAEILRAKLADAKNVLDSEEDEEENNSNAVEPTSQKSAETQSLTAPVTPQTKKIGRSGASIEESPKTPALSSRGPSAAASPAPVTPSAPQHTIASLAQLPAAEIIRLANSASATGLPLPKADPLVTKATDEFIDSLMGELTTTQKQRLGDKLFKTIRAFGVKSAPKITILLLDQEDLRALAHLMNSYPSVLKEKVQRIQSGAK